MSYINIDSIHFKKGFYTLPFDNLPFEDKSIKDIHFNFAALEYCPQKPEAFIPELKRILVNGGSLVIDNLEDDPKKEDFLANLRKNGFTPYRDNTQYSEARQTYLLGSFGRLKKLVFKEKDKKDIREHLLNYLDAKELDPTLQKTLEESQNPILLEGNLRDEETLEVATYDGGEARNYDTILAVNILEHYPYIASFISDARHLFVGLKGKILFICRNETSEENTYFYDKNRLAEAIDLSGYPLQKLCLLDDASDEKDLDRYSEASFLFCELPIGQERNSFNPILRENVERKRICTIGEYGMLSYSLLGYHQDGIARALKELGMKSRLIDYRRTQDFGKIRDEILEFQPDYLLRCLEDCLKLIKEIYPDIKHLGIKILYWFCDAEYRETIDVREEVDHMFLTNTGLIPKYKKMLGIENIHFMPQASDPGVMFDRSLNRLYDVGFAGSVDLSSVHKRRTRLIHEMREKINIRTVNNVRNNIGRFYSQSKMVFNLNDYDHELCVSNRFYITLGCGAVNLTNYFPGMERIARDGEHVVSFIEDAELYEKLEYYLKNEDKLEAIRLNAKRLADEKHTYSHRLKNMLDIADGRVTEFTGFLEEKKKSCRYALKKF